VTGPFETFVIPPLEHSKALSFVTQHGLHMKFSAKNLLRPISREVWFNQH
jgi:hypothetical protein